MYQKLRLWTLKLKDFAYVSIIYCEQCLDCSESNLNSKFLESKCMKKNYDPSFHPFFVFLFFYHCQPCSLLCGGTGVSPSCFSVKAELHPGQVARLWQRLLSISTIDLYLSPIAKQNICYCKWARTCLWTVEETWRKQTTQRNPWPSC